MSQPPQPLAPSAHALVRSIEDQLKTPAALMVPAGIRQSVQRLGNLVLLMSAQIDALQHRLTQEPKA